MSSKIVPRDSELVGSIPWRQTGGQPQAPLRADQEQSRGIAETAQLKEAIAALEARLAAAVRSGDEREARALEKGRQEGFLSGQRDAAASTQAECSRQVAAVKEEAAERAAGTAAQAVELRRRVRQQMEADLVRLAVAVARRILRRELSVDPEALLGIVRTAVEKIAARDLLAIRVAPHDAPRISACLAGLRLPDRVEVIADTSLPWGSVLFDTTRGQHDASVETQIEEIDRGLADVVGRQA
jgi:flagellar assembly protein FliH